MILFLGFMLSKCKQGAELKFSMSSGAGAEVTFF